MRTSVVDRWLDVEALRAEDSTVVAIDHAFTIRWVNPAWERFALANGGTDVPSRYGCGASYMDGIAPPLRAFYEATFAAALARRAVFEQTYECSSADLFRVFRLRALPFDSETLVLEHSLVVEGPHVGIASDLPPSSYARPDGTILQCSNCRRVRRAEGGTWDWIPAWTKASPKYTSHGLCVACSAFYYGVEQC